MKRIVQALMWMTVLLGPVYAQSATAPFVGFCVNGGVSATTSGQPSTNKLQGVIPLCTVTVYLTGTTTQATLYKDNSNTILTNPFQANVDGSWLFFAGTTTGFFNQGYDVVLSGGYAPNAYTTPRTLTGQYEIGANSLDSMVDLLTSMVPITTAGCVPNSTAPAVMTANVACLNTLLNVPGRYYAGPGVWNLNACVQANNQGGFVLEGAGVYATSIIQNTGNTCVLKVGGFFPNEFRVSDMTLGHAVRQSPAAENTATAAVAISLSPTSGGSVFNFELSRLLFQNSARGIDFDKTTTGTAWGYKITDILSQPGVTSATINVNGTNAGNPRCYMQRIYNEALLTTEPMISTNACDNLIEDVEDTPSTIPVSIPITAYATSGATVTLTATNSFVSGQTVMILASVGPTFLNANQYTVLASGLSPSQFQVTQIGASGSGAATGTVLLAPYSAAFDFSGGGGSLQDIHIENWTIGDRNHNQGIIFGENSTLTMQDLFIAAYVCPAPFPCNTQQPTVWVASDNAGQGNLTMHNIDMQAYVGSAASTKLYAMRYGGNTLAGPSCDGWTNSFTASLGVVLADSQCVDPASDTGQVVRAQNVLQAPASALAASSWAVTSVANTLNGQAVYAGTFTGCPPLGSRFLAAPPMIGNVLVSGFVTSANNGYYPFVACTANTLTLKNGGSVAETHAATAVSGIDSSGFNYAARLWNGAASATATCTQKLEPVYNPATGFWDESIQASCTQPPAGSTIFTTTQGWARDWVANNGPFADWSPARPGLSGAWQTMSYDGSGSIPTLRGYKNAGGPTWFSGDLRLTQGGFLELCPSTSGNVMIGTETPQTDLFCSFMVDKNGNWFNQNGVAGGSAVAIVPGWVTGHHGSAAGVTIPLATNWANTTGAVTCDDGAGNLTITGCVGLALSVTFTTTVASPENVTLTGATTGTHCAFGAKNATAATNIATAYIVSETANTISFAHAATAGMVYEFVCR